MSASESESGSASGSETASSASAASAAASMAATAEVPARMRLFVRHIRDHGAALYAEAAAGGGGDSAAATTAPPAAAPAAADPRENALEAQLRALAAKVDQLLLEKHKTNEERDLEQDLGQDRARAHEEQQQQIEQRPEQPLKPRKSTLASNGGEFEAEVGPTPPPAAPHTQALEQRIAAQQNVIEKLLKTIEATSAKVDQLSRERELELEILDEDSLGDIGTRSLTTTLRRFQRTGGSGAAVEENDHAMGNSATKSGGAGGKEAGEEVESMGSFA